MATVAKTPRTTTSTVASAIAGPYSIGFRLFDDDGLKVYVNGVERADFTISSAYDEGYDDSASITFSTALSVLDVLTIDASLAPWRQTDLVNGDASLVQKLNVELGRLWSAMSDIKRDTLRSLRGFDAIAPVGGVDLSAISGAEAFATAAAASADEAEIAAALAVDAQQNLYDNYAGAWANTTNYTRGQWVQHDGSSYLCIATHTSLGTLNAPGTGFGWGGYWALFAAKGNAGAGTGDVLAANAGSEYTSVAGAFRNNISAMLRAITKRTGLDLATDTTIDSSIYNSDGTNTNGPSGNADGDSFVSSKINNSTYNYLWFGNARAWLGRRVADVNTWVELATKAYVDSKTLAGWQPYDGATGVIYDHAVTGAVASIETPEFEDGYEYMLVIDMLEAATGTPQIEIEFYREQAAAYSSKANLSLTNQKFHVGEAVFFLPRVVKRSHHVWKALHAAASITNASRSNDTAYTTSVIHTTATALLKARLSFNTAVNFVGGKVTMLRRPEGLS